MFELNFNELEKERLLSYASQSMRDNLHWGDGEVIIPEEQILEQKIQETEYKLALDFNQLRLLTNWFLDATDEGLLLAGEDISILTKIIGLLTTYHNELKREYDVKLRMLKAQIDDAEKILTKLTNIVPKTGEKLERISEKRREVEEYNKELIDKFKKERIDNQHDEMSDEKVEIEEDQKKEDFKEKVKRAKELKEEIQKAENVAKKAKKKTKGKKLW